MPAPRGAQIVATMIWQRNTSEGRSARVTRPASIALIAAIAVSDCAASTGQTRADATAPAQSDATCSGQRTPSEVASVDPASGCPREVLVTHVWSGRRVCDRVEAACDAAPTCRFVVRLRAPALAGCVGRAVDARFTMCRCEFGVVECSTRSEDVGEWPGCVNNSTICYDCDR